MSPTDVAVDRSTDEDACEYDPLFTELMGLATSVRCTEEYRALVSVCMTGSLDEKQRAIDCHVDKLVKKKNTGNSNRPRPTVENEQHPPWRQRNYGRTKVNDRRSSDFKKAQDLHLKSKPALVELILKGKGLSSTPSTPTLENAENLDRGIFESESPIDERPYRPATDQEQIITPVTRQDVENAKAGWKNSAPGPDGITTQQVKALPTQMLANLFNLLLYTGITPTQWTACRTILIYKDGDPTDPGNWRPLTIGSSVQGLFHRILSGRIREFVELSVNQRGFTNIDGTLANKTSI